MMNVIRFGTLPKTTHYLANDYLRRLNNNRLPQIFTAPLDSLYLPDTLVDQCMVLDQGEVLWFSKKCFQSGRLQSLPCVYRTADLVLDMFGPIGSLQITVQDLCCGAIEAYGPQKFACQTACPVTDLARRNTVIMLRTFQQLGNLPVYLVDEHGGGSTVSINQAVAMVVGSASHGDVANAAFNWENDLASAIG